MKNIKILEKNNQLYVLVILFLQAFWIYTSLWFQP